jgi:hypothetical protein
MEMDTSGNIIRNVVYSTQTPSGMFFYNNLLNSIELTNGKIISYSRDCIFATVDSFLHPSCQYLDNPIYQTYDYYDSSIVSGGTTTWSMPLYDLTASFQTSLLPLLTVTDICSFILYDWDIQVKNQIGIFPNPFHTSATITANRQFKVGSMRLRIFNSMGVLVRSEKIPNITSYILHRGDLTDGLYFYELRTNDSELLGTGKFVVE